ncbi:MAG: hypothetical protein J0L63_13215 [Anaerolineae bacterium]|nr:hypothetical protein [Anaerolineae bacterium]
MAISATSLMPIAMGVAASVPVLLLGLSLELGASGLIVWVLGAFIGGWLFGSLLHYLTRPAFDRILDHYVQSLDMVVLGDLRQRLDVKNLKARSDEERMLRRLGEAVNRMLDRLQGIVAEISDAVARVEADTHEILEGTARQISMTNEQDAVVTETTATVNEVRATVTETAERAQSVAETAQVSVDISRNGTEAVTQTVLGMEVIRHRVEDIADNILVLSENTQQIGEIIATVNNLADQSRMLALNASVEAARAGEEGKGFAVVALEVRNLADQNREATVQVREILGEIQRATNAAVMVTEEGSKGVDTGQQLVNRAGDSIRELSHAIEEAALAAMQIAASTRQQTIGMDQLTQAMRTIKKATTETLNTTMQVKASVQNLRDASNRINMVLSGLKL